MLFRSVSPLNRPVFGGTGGALTDIQTFDQRNSSVTVDATQNLITGGNVDLNYSPARTNVNQNVATGFLFNPAWTGGLALTLTQPLLRNAGVDVTKTFIRVAQNNADVEQHIFRDRVLTVLATVEQTYWELVFANENLKVAQAALKAAEELLPSLHGEPREEEEEKIAGFRNQEKREAKEEASTLLGVTEAAMKPDRKSTRLNSSHIPLSRMPSSA